MFKNNWPLRIHEINNPKINYQIAKVYNNDLIDINSSDAFIITGSKYSVYDNVPWINRLVDFVKSLIEHKKPVLGICFGHQVIAKSIGADVIKNPLGWELGSYSIDLTKLGLNHELFLGINNFLSLDIPMIDALRFFFVSSSP